MVRWFGKRARKAVVLGLDCAAPQLIFEQFQHDLPTFAELMRGSIWGELESSIPCITVPAWTSMLSSRDPGAIGVYGFRNRSDYSYSAMTTADNRAVGVRRLWDYLGDAGRRSVVLGVPQTYPVRPLHGEMVSCFLTPNTDSAFAYPAMLKQEVLSTSPGYLFDTRDFRTDDKAQLRESLHDMTELQFRVVEKMLTTHTWDLFMYVNIGVDRVHHGFWRYYDPQHRLYSPGSPFADVIFDYYRQMDAQLRRILDRLDEDTLVLVVSDHGAKRMDGGICINEWLWRNGWLTLKTPPRDGEIVAIDKADVDWTRTKAWASGGYYARVFLNVKGREPQGVLASEEYEVVRDALSAALCAIPGSHGERLATSVYKPQEIYQSVTGIAPDLMVYFGDLHWRAVGGLGYGRHYTLENDTGPDDANHAQNGMFILYDPRSRARGLAVGHQLMDIAPTLLERMGVDVPREMQGRVIG